jgi:hypothetical protein
MGRVQNLCVITSVVLLVAGISAPYLTPNTGWDIRLGRTGFGLSWQTPCYGVAALFSIFAFLYSIRYIPFHQTVVQWHFWLSVVCVLWFSIGEVALYMALRNETSLQLGVTGEALALSFLATIPIFLLTQLLFVFELARAVITMRLA